MRSRTVTWLPRWRLPQWSQLNSEIFFQTNPTRKHATMSDGTSSYGVATWQHLPSALRWRHNGYDSVLNHRRLDCLLNRLFRRRSKKASKLRVTGLCEGNSPVTGEFPSQRARNAENVSIWWRHHMNWLTKMSKLVAHMLLQVGFTGKYVENEIYGLNKTIKAELKRRTLHV